MRTLDGCLSLAAMNRNLLAAAAAIGLLAAAAPAFGDACTDSGDCPYTASSSFGGEMPSGGLRAPDGAAATADGTLYVADSEHHRVLKFGPSGELVDTWGRRGTAPGEFNQPSDIAIDAEGAVYVADMGNHRVQKFSADGTHLMTVGGTWGESCADAPFAASVDVDAAGTIYVLHGGGRYKVARFTPAGASIGCWGEFGTGDAQVRYPNDLDVEPDGDVYLADTANDRVQKFTATGAPLTRWGSAGSGDGQMDAPTGVTVTPSGEVWVADTGNDRVLRFSATGELLGKAGSTGAGPGEFRAPADVVPGAPGAMLVTDRGNNRVQQLTTAGAHVRTVGEPPAGAIYAPGQPAAADGSVWITDYATRSVQRFSQDGAFERRLAAPAEHPGALANPTAVAADRCGDNVYVTSPVERPLAERGTAPGGVARFRGDGAFLGTLGEPGGRPVGVAVGPDGSVWTIDADDYEVRRHTADGTFVSAFQPDAWARSIAVAPNGDVVLAGSSVFRYEPDGDVAAGWPEDGVYAGFVRGLAVDGAGNVVVTDSDSDDVRKLSPTGEELAEWGGWGDALGELINAGGVAVGRDGTVLVADTGNRRVQRFTGAAVADGGPACPEPQADGPKSGGDQVGGAGGHRTPQAGSGSAADRTPPRVTLTGSKRQRRRAVLRKGLAVRCAADEGTRCALTVTVTKRDAKRLRLKGKWARRIAVRSVPLGRGVRLRLAAPARKRLGVAKRLAVTVTATVTDAAGNPAQARLRTTIVP